MSSPGAGKTTLLERSPSASSRRASMAVIEGDIETERDAERIRAKGVPAWQITTGGACHLEAKMIGKILPDVDPDIDFLFIENVGNLVCPASYELGEHLRCVLLSTPEGDDKPKKYPKAFTTSDVLVLTKADLLASSAFRHRKSQRAKPSSSIPGSKSSSRRPSRARASTSSSTIFSTPAGSLTAPCMSFRSSPASSTRSSRRPGARGPEDHPA